MYRRRYWRFSEPPLIPLLRTVSEGRTDLRLSDFDQSQIEWAVETGLGPLLLRSIESNSNNTVSPYWALIKGADLTARVLNTDQLEAMTEIIDACQGDLPPLTLLKGIALCGQYYAEPHFRTMRDIDFLVEGEAVPLVESVLRDLGYVQKSHQPPEFYRDHQHTTPFFNAETGVWVEVHRGLFRSGTELGLDGVFSLETIRKELCPSKFIGRPVNRFSPELQIVYLASHWAFSLELLGAMHAMVDLIFILRQGRTIKWPKILAWLDASRASAPLYLLLTYLEKYRLIEISPEILHELFLKQRCFGYLNLALLHSLIDHYFVGGRRLGMIMSKRNFDIIWRTLLLPGPPYKNLMRVPWNLMPARFLPRWLRLNR
jgi:hypothetical protein